MKLPKNILQATSEIDLVTKLFDKVRRRAYTLNQGFTMIELLIVIAVIGLLASITLSAINPLGQFAKARDAQRKSDLGQIQKALQLYYQDHNQFPRNLQNQNYYLYIGDPDCANCDWGGSWKSLSTGQIYLAVIPKDPRYPSFGYHYYVSDPPSNQTYYLYAHLENPGDPQACKDSTGKSVNCLSVPNGWGCGGTGVCNYAVTSPNVTP